MSIDDSMVWCGLHEIFKTANKWENETEGIDFDSEHWKKCVLIELIEDVEKMQYHCERILKIIQDNPLGKIAKRTKEARENERSNTTEVPVLCIRPDSDFSDDIFESFGEEFSDEELKEAGYEE